MLIEVKTTRTGQSYVCESGGAALIRGAAQIVCGKDGEKLKPFFEFTRLEPNGNHVAFRVQPGLHIISGRIERQAFDHSLYDLTISVVRILGESNRDGYVEVEPVTPIEGDGRYILGKWTSDAFFC